MDLIYCAGSNKRLTRIAHEEGFLLGMRSDKLAYDFPISFVDINYKKPDFLRHLLAVAKLCPRYAVTLDLSETETSLEDVERAVNEADILSDYCEIPLIVPKRPEQIALIPPKYAIAYSVPSKYGGANFGGPWQLTDRRIHLLGGSPHMQMKLYQFLKGSSVEVISADGNMAMKMATQFAKYWQGFKWVQHPMAHSKQEDLYLECWQWSCQNIYNYWQYLTGKDESWHTMILQR